MSTRPAHVPPDGHLRKCQPCPPCGGDDDRREQSRKQGSVLGGPDAQGRTLRARLTTFWQKELSWLTVIRCY